MSIDLIIMTYKPDKTFLRQVEEMVSQTVPVDRVIIFNKEEKYFDRLLFTTKFMDDHKNLEVHHQSAREYDCGKSRNMAAKLSNADYVIFMDQGVIPEGKDLIDGLLKPFTKDDKVCMSYARLIPGGDLGEGEKHIYSRFFPEESVIKSSKDEETMGWKAYFSSNACAMYRRDIFSELGGFLNHVICNEDMLFAAKAIKEGYKIAYVSEAVAVRGLSLSEGTPFGLSFDFAVSLVKHPELFNAEEIYAEIKRSVKNALAAAKRSDSASGRRFKATASEWLKGFKKGRNFKHLNRSKLHKLSANREYWRADELLRDRSAVDSHQGYGRSEEEMNMLRGNKIKTHKWE
ncbi:MAG: glycosyltransferase family 2 protein [Lachnospiraceae bacterium]|nr:glycosyltransferase family 2 protein [Lachnospiraceae bacterium]